MKVSPYTLLTLKNEAKDEKAKEAYEAWLSLASLQDPPQLVIECHYIPNKDVFYTGLTWLT